MNTTEHIEPITEEAQEAINETGEGGIPKLRLFIFVTLTTIVGVGLAGYAGWDMFVNSYKPSDWDGVFILAIIGGTIGLFIGFLICPIKFAWQNAFTFLSAGILLIVGFILNIILIGILGYFCAWYDDYCPGMYSLFPFLIYSIIGLPILTWRYYVQYRKRKLSKNAKNVIDLVAAIPLLGVPLAIIFLIIK